MTRQNIVLIGFMGSGKSSIGRRLARKLKFRLVDTDQLVVDRAGLEISEIFAQFGEAHFRELETAALESLRDVEGHVIATGGGVILRENNRALLQGLGFVVELTATEDVFFNRVSRNAQRPLLQTENPRETMCRILSERRGLYEAAAQFRVDTSHLAHDQIATLIVAEARRRFPCQTAP